MAMMKRFPIKIEIPRKIRKNKKKLPLTKLHCLQDLIGMSLQLTKARGSQKGTLPHKRTDELVSEKKKNRIQNPRIQNQTPNLKNL